MFVTQRAEKEDDSCPSTMEVDGAKVCSAFRSSYELGDVVGRGGTGTVYKAWHKVLQRHVAIKVVEDSESAFEKLMREAKLAKLLNHESIAEIYSFGRFDDKNRFYLAVEWVEGQSLADFLKNKGALSRSEFIAVFEQVLEAMDFAHRHGVIHRDLKPANIMLAKSSQPTQSNQRATVKIIDFGLAKIISSDASSLQVDTTKSGSVQGSPVYMSPEQCQGHRGDETADIYSLGVIMYECLSGTPPFSGETPFDVMYKQIHEEPVALKARVRDAAARGFSPLVMRCLVKSSSQRFQNISDVIARFTEISKNAAPQENMPTRGKLVALVLPTIALVLVFSGLLLFALNKNKQVSAERPFVRAEKRQGIKPLSSKAMFNQAMAAAPQSAKEEQLKLLIKRSDLEPIYAVLASLELGETYLISGREEYCSQITENVLENIKKTDADQWTDPVIFQVDRYADTLHIRALFREEVRLLKELMAVFEKCQTPIVQKLYIPETLRRLARVYHETHEYVKAETTFAKLRAHLSRHPSAYQSAMACQEEARYYQIAGRWNECKQAYRDSVKAALNLPDDDYAAVPMLLSANSFLSRHNERDEADKQFKEAVRRIRCVPSVEVQRRLQLDLGEVQAKNEAYQGDFAKAVQTLKQVENLIPQCANPALANMMCYSMQAAYLFKLGKYAEAHAALAKSNPAGLKNQSSANIERLAIVVWQQKAWWIEGGIAQAEGRDEEALTIYSHAFTGREDMIWVARDKFIWQIMKNSLPLFRKANPKDERIKLLEDILKVMPDGIA